MEGRRDVLGGVSQDQHLTWGDFADSQGQVADRTGTRGSDGAVVQDQCVGASVVDFDEFILARIALGCPGVEFRNQQVVHLGPAVASLQGDRDFHKAFLGGLDCECDLAAERVQREFRDGAVFGEGELVRNTVDGLSFLVEKKNFHLVFATELEHVTLEDGAVDGLFHGDFVLVGCRFQLHRAARDARVVLESERDFYEDEPYDRVHLDRQVHGGSCRELGLQFAHLHQGAVCVDLRLEVPAVAREKLQAEVRIVGGMYVMQRIGAVAVQHEAVQERRGAVVQAERNIGGVAFDRCACGSGIGGVVAAVPEGAGAQEQGGEGNVFFQNRTHFTSVG